MCWKVLLGNRWHFQRGWLKSPLAMFEWRRFCNVWVGLRESNKEWWSTPGRTTTRSVMKPRPGGNGKESLWDDGSYDYRGATLWELWSLIEKHSHVKPQPGRERSRGTQILMPLPPTFQSAALAFHWLIQPEARGQGSLVDIVHEI